MMLPGDTTKAATFIENGLIKVLPGPIELIPCPTVISNVTIPYSKKAKILVLTAPQATGFIFIVRGGHSVKLEALSDIPNKLNIPSFIIAVRKENLILYCRSGKFELDRGKSEDLFNRDSIYKWLLSPAPKKSEARIFQKEQTRSIEFVAPRSKGMLSSSESSIKGNKMNEKVLPLDRETIEAVIARQSVKDASVLADATKALSSRLRSNGPEDRALWVKIAETSLKILPAAIASPDQYAKAIEAIARSIIFLSPEGKIKAVRQLLICALDPAISLQDTERTTSVILAIIPMLELSKLAPIGNELFPLVRERRSIPSGLAQVFSLLLRRG